MPSDLLNFVGYCDLASLFVSQVDNRKVGVDNRKRGGRQQKSSRADKWNNFLMIWPHFSIQPAYQFWVLLLVRAQKRWAHFFGETTFWGAHFLFGSTFLGEAHFFGLLFGAHFFIVLLFWGPNCLRAHFWFGPTFSLDQLSVWAHFWLEPDVDPNQKRAQTRSGPKLEAGLKKITQKCNKTSCCIVAWSNLTIVSRFFVD